MQTEDGQLGIAHLLKGAGLVSSTSEAFRMIKQGAPSRSTASGSRTAPCSSRLAARISTRWASASLHASRSPEQWQRSIAAGGRACRRGECSEQDSGFRHSGAGAGIADGADRRSRAVGRRRHARSSFEALLRPERQFLDSSSDMRSSRGPSINRGFSARA